MTPPPSRAPLGPDLARPDVPAPDLTVPDLTPAVPAPDVLACPSCGETAEPADRFCEACGAALPVPEEPPVTAGTPGGPGVASRTDLRAAAERPQECPACGPGTADDGWCSDCGRPVPVGRDHVEETVPDAAAITDRGLVRPRNEDAYALARVPVGGGVDGGAGPARDVVLAVVCDGVASVPGGDEASLAACEAALEAGVAAVVDGGAAEDVAATSAVAARAAVDALAATAPVGVTTGPSTGRVAGRRSPTVPADPPACTYVAAVVDGDEVVVSWVGDSRAYWLDATPDARSCLLSTDDSWAAEVVAAGLLDPAAAWADRRAHIITRWLAADAPEHPAHQLVLRPDAAGVLLLCSDGLWNHVPDATDLAGLLETDADGGVDTARSARALLRAALDDGGHDNTTLVLVPVTTGSADGGRDGGRG